MSGPCRCRVRTCERAPHRELIQADFARSASPSTSSATIGVNISSALPLSITTAAVHRRLERRQWRSGQLPRRSPELRFRRSNNRAEWCNKDFDALINKAKTVSDQAERTSSTNRRRSSSRNSTVGDARSTPRCSCRCRRPSPALRWIRSASIASTASISPNKVAKRGRRHAAPAPLARHAALYPRQARPHHPDFIGITIPPLASCASCPGPVLVLAGERGLSPERHAALMHQFGFDLPIWRQYLTYLANILSGDFGTSFSTKTRCSRTSWCGSRLRSSSPSSP